MDLEQYKKLLENDEELISHLCEDPESGWFYERYLYFSKCIGDNCKYADACVKLMKEDIDGFYSRRETNNAP
jgi:hypothetical protein